MSGTQMVDRATALVRAAVEALAPNLYEGSCISCGRAVASRQGYLVTDIEGRRRPICRVDLADVARRYEVQVPQALVERPQQPRTSATLSAQDLRSLHGTVETPAPAPATKAATPNFRRGVQDTLDVEAPAQTARGHVRVQAANGQVYTGVAPGIYTMTYADGHHRTFRVRVQRTDDDFAPGKAILEYLFGPQNDSDYQAFGFISGDGQRLQPWRRFREGHSALLGDAEAFLAAPWEAEVAQHCIRCNAVLTTPESIALGIGPTCLNKGW